MTTDKKPYDLTGGIYIEIPPLNYLYLALAIVVPALLIITLKHTLK